MVEDPKTDEQGGQAGSNAISILDKAETQFNGADLRDIRITRADLRGGSFDSADLKGADLSGVNLSKAWLRQANLNGIQMTGVQFGELPYLKMEKEVLGCVLSHDGELLAVSINETGIDIFIQHRVMDQDRHSPRRRRHCNFANIKRARQEPSEEQHRRGGWHSDRRTPTRFVRPQ